jgi:hypothetical protein
MRVVEAGSALAPSQWALRANDLQPPDRRAVPVVLGLVESEDAPVGDDESVSIAHATLARLDAQDLRRLGLPEPAPVVVSIENEGLLTDRDFRFRYTLLGLDGRPVLGWSRQGVLVTFGCGRWTVSDPLFRLLEAMDAFNAAPTESADERFRRWGEIRQLLPGQAEVDEYLRGTQVGFATAFTLDVRAGEDGEVTFDPVLVRPRASTEPPVAPTLDDQDAEPARDVVRSLPDGAAAALAQQFKQHRKARANYPLGDGWYMAIDRPVQMAMQIVREMQDASGPERRAFAANPHAVLRARLADQVPEEDLEQLFYEPPDYGQRVAAAGIWKPKVLPFLKQATEAWLPPEVLGILIGGQELQLTPEQVAPLKGRVERAIEQGFPSVDHEGARVPATDETVRALDVLQHEIERAAARAAEGSPAPKDPIERQVLLLQDRDNLLELGYAAGDWKSRSGTPAIPRGLASRLKPHQVNGLEWMQRHWLAGSPGGLLADDMGLGKTFQTLAFLLWMRAQPGFREQGSRPILVVAPTGLLVNWADEHQQHLEYPGVGDPLRAYGAALRGMWHEESRGQREAKTGAPVLQVARLQEADWVLTTYETLRDYVHSFGRVKWSAAVLDEAQKIKNPGALVTEECKAVLSNADFVVAMTGTPVENRLADLWSIVDSCQPGVLRDLRSFVNRYDTKQDRDGAELVALKDQITHTEFPCIDAPRLMLRRMKWQELRGLPEKKTEELRAEMPVEQAAAYDGVVARARIRGREMGGMLEALHHLRSISLHPRPLETDEPDDRYIAASARLSRTISVLDQIHERRERALIFLESRDMQPVLQGLLQRRYALDRPPMLINGEVAGDMRKQMVRRFQSGDGFDCMILSPKAGGVGLTLTSANHVIHLSRWWNPAVEDQCTDRIYRIGQDRPVFVHIPMAIHPRHAEHSFDERLHALLGRKRELSRQVLGLAPGGGSNDDLQGLYGDTVGSAE